MLKRLKRKPRPEPLPEVAGDSFAASLLRRRPDLLQELARRRVQLNAVLYIIDQSLAAATLGDADRKLRRKHQERDVVLRSFRDWARRLRTLCADEELIRDGDRIAGLLVELDRQLEAAAVSDPSSGGGDRNAPFGIKGAASAEWQVEATQYLKLLYVPLRVARELVAAIAAEAQGKSVSNG